VDTLDVYITAVTCFQNDMLSGCM